MSPAVDVDHCDSLLRTLASQIRSDAQFTRLAVVARREGGGSQVAVSLLFLLVTPLRYRQYTSAERPARDRRHDGIGRTRGSRRRSKLRPSLGQLCDNSVIERNGRNDADKAAHL